MKWLTPKEHSSTSIYYATPKIMQYDPFCQVCLITFRYHEYAVELRFWNIYES